MEKNNHLHLAFFGSELCCSICNPFCSETHSRLHSNGNQDYLKPCDNPSCPLKIKAHLDKFEITESMRDDIKKYAKEAAEKDVEMLLKELSDILEEEMNEEDIEDDDNDD